MIIILMKKISFQISEICFCCY